RARRPCVRSSANASRGSAGSDLGGPVRGDGGAGSAPRPRANGASRADARNAACAAETPLRRPRPRGARLAHLALDESGPLRQPVLAPAVIGTDILDHQWTMGGLLTLLAVSGGVLPSYVHGRDPPGSIVCIVLAGGGLVCSGRDGVADCGSGAAARM